MVWSMSTYSLTKGIGILFTKITAENVAKHQKKSVASKPVFGVSDKVRHKPTYIAIEAS